MIFDTPVPFGVRVTGRPVPKLPGNVILMGYSVGAGATRTLSVAPTGGADHARRRP